MTFYEITPDHGYPQTCYASNNAAEYIITSAIGHDLHSDYMRKYHRNPTSAWYRRHFSFKRVK